MKVIQDQIAKMTYNELKDLINGIPSLVKADLKNLLQEDDVFEDVCCIIENGEVDGVILDSPDLTKEQRENNIVFDDAKINKVVRFYIYDGEDDAGMAYWDNIIALIKQVAES